jgi:hypothetical protein
MTEHDYIRQMFETVNNSVLSLAAQVNTLSKEMAEQRGESASFRREVLRHFDSCPVDELREHTGQIDVELERLKVKRQADSSDKHSRPPKSNRVAYSERTVQMFLGVLLLIMTAIGVITQVI